MAEQQQQDKGTGGTAPAPAAEKQKVPAPKKMPGVGADIIVIPNGASTPSFGGLPAVPGKVLRKFDEGDNYMLNVVVFTEDHDKPVQHLKAVRHASEQSEGQCYWQSANEA